MQSPELTLGDLTDEESEAILTRVIDALEMELTGRKPAGHALAELKAALDDYHLLKGLPESPPRPDRGLKEDSYMVTVELYRSITADLRAAGQLAAARLDDYGRLKYLALAAQDRLNARPPQEDGTHMVVRVDCGGKAVVLDQDDLEFKPSAW